MAFQCFVCDKYFSRAQDRSSHIRLKKDDGHKHYLQQQQRNIIQQFSATVEAATSAAANNSPNLPPVLDDVSVRWNDVDIDDMTSSWNMDIDTTESGFDSDDEHSIISCPEVPILEDEDHHHIEEAMAAASYALGGIDLDDIPEAFDFLPDPDVDVPEGASGGRPSTAETQGARRTLVDIDAEKPTYKWHQTAGQVYGQEPTNYARWQSLFNLGPDIQAYEPFKSRLDWEVAQWAVKEKIPQKSFNRLLNIPQVKEQLGLSFTSARSMLQTVDTIPERSGQWFTKQLAFKDRPNEFFHIRHRDPIEAIKALWGDPAFSRDLVYKPAKMFRGDRQTEDQRMYSEMWTGGLWNAAQEAIPPGGTVVPVIIASDKTRLTQFAGNKSAYPVYLTIGNIPKSLRRKPRARACVLIAYLSVDKISDGLSAVALRVRNYELFHRSMALVLNSLKAAGNPRGPGISMTGGDGAVRRVYPILSTYVADYPEQCLVTCTKSGTCPKCQQIADALENPTPGQPRKQKWTWEVIFNARRMSNLTPGRHKSVHAMCMEHDISGGNYEPFWVGFPLVDIHRCVAPDILHQLYQGVLKHLIGWVQTVVGEEGLDQRISVLPPAPGVRHFKNGISALTQVTGTERKHIARILLSCLVGKIPSKGIIACRSLLNFIHLAQYPSHDEETLGYLQQELDTWQQYRSYFIQDGIRESFNIPKFHSLLHYINAIRWLGTTDNYNTEMFERLHIDFAKEGWRASNKRDHFPQMVKWLSRQEKIASYDFYRSWLDESQNYEVGDFEEAGDDEEAGYEFQEPGGDSDQVIAIHGVKRVVSESGIGNNASEARTGQISLSKHPAEPKKSLVRILISHAAPGFIAHLKLFLNSHLPPPQQVPKLQALAGNLPFTNLDVWHQYKFSPINLFNDDSDGIKEIVKAVPIYPKAHIPRFDTVIVLDTDEAESTAVQGCRVARLRIIFRLPKLVNRNGFPEPAPLEWPTHPLAYVTWFTRFRPSPDNDTGMYRVEPAKDSKAQAQGIIIPLTDIRQSCMLTPSKAHWDPTWTKDNILDRCDSFFVNNMQSKYSYQTIY